MIISYFFSNSKVTLPEKIIQHMTEYRKISHSHAAEGFLDIMQILKHAAKYKSLLFFDSVKHCNPLKILICFAGLALVFAFRSRLLLPLPQWNRIQPGSTRLRLVDQCELSSSRTTLPE